MSRHPLAPMVIFCNSDAYIAFPATPWMDPSDWVYVREALESRNMPGSNAMTVAVGLQTAQTPDAPDAAAALATSRTTDGLTFPGAPADKSASTGNKQLVRGVYLAKNTTASDTTVRFCWVGGMIETRRA